LRRLDKAFAAFFRRVKAGDKPGYPRFRGVNWFDTVDFPKDGDGCRWDSTPHDSVTRVRLQGVGHVKVNRHRPVVGKVKTVSVKREGKRWYVILTAEQAQPDPHPRSLPLVDWAENCGSYTRDWWAAQDWIPKATVEAEDDGAVLSLVSAGHGMAIMPALSLVGAPDSVGITDLGPERPTRQVGYVTTSELAGSAVVRALVRELRATLPQDVSLLSREA
jgi:hypothetical protein